MTARPDVPLLPDLRSLPFRLQAVPADLSALLFVTLFNSANLASHAASRTLFVASLIARDLNTPTLPTHLFVIALSLTLLGWAQHAGRGYATAWQARHPQVHPQIAVARALLLSLVPAYAGIFSAAALRPLPQYTISGLIAVAGIGALCYALKLMLPPRPPRVARTRTTRRAGVPT